MAIDCPNDSFQPSDDGSICVPATGSVGIACNPTNMVVTFDAGHLYVNMDSIHANNETSAAYVGDCASVTSVDGVYTLEIPLDGCDTQVDQADGKITFTNTVFGEDDALRIDNIITTEKLQLDVACSYSDEFDLLVSDIGIEAAGHTLGDIAVDGEMDDQFRLASYSDEDFLNVINATNSVIIGEPVYNQVSVVGSIPSNVDFVVKSCTAMDLAEEATATYDIMKHGCLDNLVATTELSGSLIGDSSTPVNFRFNGFTFESNSDTLYVECNIVLCAVDDSGAFLNPDCGFSFTNLTTTCETAAEDSSSALGYSLATDPSEEGDDSP